MWALKAKNCMKNRVNDGKFVNFNTAILKKHHSAYHFSFKSYLAKLLGNKITNLYQKQWLLICKMVAQRCEGWLKFSFWFFTFSNNYPKIFLCSVAVLRDVNNFHEKQPREVVAFLTNIARKQLQNAKNLCFW